MKKVYISSTGEITLPKKYVGVYPLRITTFYMKQIIYHKKGFLYESSVTYTNMRKKPYIDHGLIKINGDIYKLELRGNE